MFDFALSFASLEKTKTPEQGEGSGGKSELAGQEVADPRHSCSVLSFRQRADAEHAPGSHAAEKREGGLATGNFHLETHSQTHRENHPEPRDPVAHPTYKTRAEGAAHPIYQLCEEPMRVKPAQPRPERPISKKTEVDIAIFLEAVTSAFPRPRDPLMPRVLRARPKKAARPFLYMAEEEKMPDETTSEVSAVNAAAAVQDEKEVVAKVGPGVTPQERGPLDVPFDPILERDSSPQVQIENSTAVKETRSVETRYDPILAGVPLRAARGKVTEINPVRPVEAHERSLIDATIEPVEPVAKPRYPLQTEVPGAAQPRLSPSQRARLRRPTELLDCNGRMTPVNYNAKP